MMKKLLLIVSLFVFSQIQSFGIEASVTYSTFKSVEENYIELYFLIVGSSVEFAALDSIQSQAAVDVTILFKKEDKVFKYDKFRLNSPISKRSIDFIDLKRYALKNGKYTLEVSFEDVNKPENKVSYDTDIRAYYSNERLQQSDIQLLSSFKKAEEGEQSAFIKNGFYLTTAPFNFYDKRADKLIFYNEIYNADKAIGEDYMITYEVEQLLGNDKKETVLIGHKRRKAKSVDVFLQQVDIQALPSGNYNLNIEVRNKTKARLSKKSVAFQRSNPNLNAEQKEIAENTDVNEEFVADFDLQKLRYSLKALAPIVSDYDGEYINTLLKEQNLDAMRLYLYSYWALLNPNNPKEDYDNYMKVADAVDKTYNSGFGYGFESDRGYTFMKYGKPNDVTKVMDEPSAPPYEIWSYYELPRTGQRNIKFLFYNPSLASGQFILLHSTARGEVNNPRWEVELYGNAQNQQADGGSIEATRMLDNMGRRARMLMEDF